MGSAIGTFLLQAILGVLDLLDAVYKGVFSLWASLAAPDTRKGTASSTGSRPAPPRVVGLILAEPDVSDISIRTVSRLTSWWVVPQCCSSTRPSTQSPPPLHASVCWTQQGLLPLICWCPGTT
jgi:hypothetical protein